MERPASSWCLKASLLVSNVLSLVEFRRRSYKLILFGVFSFSFLRFVQLDKPCRSHFGTSFTPFSKQFWGGRAEDHVSERLLVRMILKGLSSLLCA